MKPARHLRVVYDPEAHGARCGECPLREEREGPPVGPEWHEGARMLLVGEAPGADEVETGRPFVGAAGRELGEALRAVGVKRSALAVTNALCCRPPGNELDRLLNRLRADNRARVARGEAPRPSPIECCAPRLRAEIEALPNVVPLGGVALRAVVGGNASILAVRGGPQEVNLEGVAVRALPSLHPAFVMRARRWRSALRADLARAWRWYTRGLDWRDPRALYEPTAKELLEWLEREAGTPFVAVDLETSQGFPEADHFDPLFDKIRCVALGSHDGARAVIVPFRSVEVGKGPFYSAVEERVIVGLLLRFLTSDRWRKVGHNFGYYDNQVLRAELGVTAEPLLDTIGLHKMADPELPHDLGYIGSILTDVSAWKAGHAATEAATDEELWLYATRDVAVTALAVEPLADAVRERGQVAQAKVFPRLQAICVGLHANGMHVDEARRREWDARLVREAQRQLEAIRARAGQSGLNPQSHPQIASLLFESWELAPHHYTETGAPSTDDDALRAILTTYDLPAERKACVQAIRLFRRATKLRGTFVLRLRPIGELAVAEPALAEDEEETAEELAERAKRGKARRPGLCLPDGRVHPDYTPHGTKGWRFSGSSPNPQNVPNRLRDMVKAAPGMVLVGCDEAQLELRLVAALSGSAYYLECFDKGEDPHRALCEDFFGDAFRSASADQQKVLRRLVKGFVYASLYAAQDKTKHELLTAAEDEETEELLFPWLTLRETGAFSRKWLARCPEVERWWESLRDEYGRHGHLVDPIGGLRCDFLDGAKVNELANYQPQTAGAMLTHLATFRALEAIPFGRWGPGTGMIQQGHDSIVFEVPEAEGERTARLLEECMTVDGREWGLPVKFEGEAKVGMTWKDV